MKYNNSSKRHNNTLAMWPLVLLTFNLLYCILKDQHCQTVTCRLFVVRSLPLFSLQFFIELKIQRMPRQIYAKVLSQFLTEYGWYRHSIIYTSSNLSLCSPITMSWVRAFSTVHRPSLVLYFDLQKAVISN